MSNASSSDIRFSDEIDHKDNFSGGEGYWHERLELETTLMMVPPSRRGKGLARIFHRASPQYQRKTHGYCFSEKSTFGTVCIAGLRGCWRSICGHFAPSLRANRHGYWLGARCANCLATRLAIIPRPSEISGLGGAE